ncbi:MAG TPA: glycosyltransferase [Euryarchaeota archaeon]|nr:glycosyltransferase [Euryarchaeota archaeon]
MISVIIPVLNEQARIRGLLRYLTDVEGDFETIVVDGGSRDKTADVAREYATVIASKRGRAVQMNTGAGRANGDILLFLHVDCLPENDAFSEVESIMKDFRVAGGALKYDIDDPSPLYRNHVFWSNLRARLAGIYLGDHGIFVRRTVFDKVGGFPAQPLMEDVELCKKLKKEGILVQAKSKITSSPRRFKQKGFTRTVLQMQANRLLYAIGVPAERLAKHYGDVR